MSLETDLSIDRRRLKRGLVVWRIIAILAVVGVVLAVVGRTGLRMPGARYVATLHVNGIITDDEWKAAAVAALAQNKRVAALVVMIDSPGGSVAGGEALHNAIAKVAAVKPVVAVMTAMAASAGYMIAVPATRIFARDSTITGSIGVMLEAPEFGGLLDKLGINVQTLVSGPLKGQPSLTAPMTPAAQQALQAMLMDLYDQFVGMVAAGRHMSPDAVRALADGRAYTGRQALALHLIDAIGSEADAREWLQANKGVPAGMQTREVRVYKPGSSFLGYSLRGLANLLFSQTLVLDGAVALWQPSSV